MWETIVAYEYYRRDEADRVHSIGIIPERKGNLQRITDKSILNLGKIILGENVGLSSLFFVQMKIEDADVIP